MKLIVGILTENDLKPTENTTETTTSETTTETTETAESTTEEVTTEPEKTTAEKTTAEDPNETVEEVTEVETCKTSLVDYPEKK